jgi:hypothetical protein
MGHTLAIDSTLIETAKNIFCGETRTRTVLSNNWMILWARREGSYS